MKTYQLKENFTARITRSENGKLYGILARAGSTWHGRWDAQTGHMLQISSRPIGSRGEETFRKPEIGYGQDQWKLPPEALYTIDWNKPIRDARHPRLAFVAATDYRRTPDDDPVVLIRGLGPNWSGADMYRNLDNTVPDWHPAPGRKVQFENVPETVTIRLRLNPDGSAVTSLKPNLELTFDGDGELQNARKL